MEEEKKLEETLDELNEQDEMFNFNSYAELNDYYFSLFQVLSDVGQSLSRKFFKTVEKTILERYIYDYKYLSLTLKPDFKRFKEEKKELLKRIKLDKKRYWHQRRLLDDLGLKYKPKYHYELVDRNGKPKKEE